MTGIELLKQFANVDTSYNLTPEQLQAKISLADALIVRSATKVTAGCSPETEQKVHACTLGRVATLLWQTVSALL
jgi:hypothetical protein